MKIPPIPDTLRQFLLEHDVFFILSHLDPDGDCIGSSLAMRSFLRRQGKVAETFNAGPFDRSEIHGFGKEFHTHIPEEMLKKYPDAGVLVLDSSSFDRVGHELEHQVENLAIAVIDHHAAGHPFGDVHYIEQGIPSTTLLIQRVIEDFGCTPTKEEAELLFLGLATDTGFFRYLDAGFGDVFHAAGRLVDTGASPRNTFRMVNDNRSAQSRKHLARLLERAEAHQEGRLFISYATIGDENEFGVNERDSDSLYYLLLNIKECEAVAFLREVEPGVTVGSLRSVEFIDVSEIAHGFGGGGHVRAAGFKLHKPLEEVKKLVLNRFNDAFEALQQ